MPISAAVLPPPLNVPLQAAPVSPLNQFKFLLCSLLSRLQFQLHRPSLVLDSFSVTFIAAVIWPNRWSTPYLMITTSKGNSKNLVRNNVKAK